MNLTVQLYNFSFILITKPVQCLDARREFWYCNDKTVNFDKIVFFV